MKILVVAMSDSIHTARWLSQMTGRGWNIHLFPSCDGGYVHPDISDVTVHHSIYYQFQRGSTNVKKHGLPLPSLPAVFLCRRILDRYWPRFRVQQLARLIHRLKPDLVHSMEIQHAGYLTLAAKKLCRGEFPPWIVTNWGSDIYLFGRLAAHKEQIKDVLSHANYYSCECQRDVCLAKVFGFAGKVLPVFPNTGGFDIAEVEGFREQGSTASRRIIMVKGYQTWAGRALVALRSLERCSDLLDGYTVAIYSATEEVEIAAELFQDTTGIPVAIIPKKTCHREMLRWHGRARISIGLSISDAISTSLLEAMVMGSFPVQSWTACADEWINDGCNGLLVPPEDPEIIEKALRKALLDDELVNLAAKYNSDLAMNRLDQRVLREKVVNFYNCVTDQL